VADSDIDDAPTNTTAADAAEEPSSAIDGESQIPHPAVSSHSAFHMFIVVRRVLLVQVSLLVWIIPIRSD
jgi:hypothetical protein